MREKSKLFTLLFFAAICFAGLGQLQASHLRGGEITMTRLSGYTYVLGAAFYRDTSGIPMGSSIFDLTEVGGTWSTSVTVAVPAPIYLGNGVERYNFLDTITLPNAGEFEITASNCCRNAAIVNMSNPSGESMTLYSTLTIPASGTNSTPVFLNDPVTIAQINTPWSYNPLPFDPDADSLYWSLVTPQSSSAPVAGYTLPAGSAPFVLDQLTGGISWTPNALGAYATAVLVEEFRNGVKIGEIVRDMQIIVIPAGNNINRAQFTNTSGWPQNAQGNYQFLLPANNAFNLTISVSDPDLDPLMLEANGEPMNQSQNPATFSYTYDAGSGVATGTFSWAPNAGQVRTNPYVLVVRSTETVGGIQLMDDLSILLQTTNATDTEEELLTEGITLFPNPSQGAFSLSFGLPSAAPVRVSLLDLQGKELSQLANQEFPAGTNLLQIKNQNLVEGLYFIKIEGLHGQPIVRKLFIRH